MQAAEDRAGAARVQWNLITNFLSLACTIGVNLLAIPLYVRLLGAEAYGLIGFYALLTATFQVFDFGLSATLARDCARFRGGTLDAAALWRVLGTFEIIFFAFAAASAAALALAARTLAGEWLRLEHLPLATVSSALMLLGLAVPVQWVTGLYRGLQVGFERQVQLAGLNSLFAIARSLGVIGALWGFGASVPTFFAYQAVVAVIELVVFAGVGRALMPPRRAAPGPAAAREAVRSLRFSAAVGFATVSWIVITQGDRLVLSKVLPLPAYGVFTLAVTASSALITMSTPLSQALLPRLTILNARQKPAEAIRLYRNGSQLAALVGLPAALVLALFSEQVLWIWTGDHALASRAAPILSAYALGSGLVPLTAFPYFLQYSRGDLRLHLAGQALVVGLFVPGVIVAATRSGPVAVGLLWTALNLAYLTVWTGVIHRKLAPGLHGSWLVKDIGVIFAAALMVALVLKRTLSWPADRFADLCELALASLLVAGAASLASSAMRTWLTEGARDLVRRGQDA